MQSVRVVPVTAVLAAGQSVHCGTGEPEEVCATMTDRGRGSPAQ
jgi:hypothetical protein